MIGCDRCEEWYHFGCVGIDQVSIFPFLLFRLPLLTLITMSLFVPHVRRRKLPKLRGKQVLPQKKRNLKLKRLLRQATKIRETLKLELSKQLSNLRRCLR